MLRKIRSVVINNDLAGISFTLLLLLLILRIFTEGFYSAYNLDSILKDIAIFTIVGMAQMVTLSVGQFNLAIGATGGAVAMIAGAMMELLGVPYPIVLLVGLICGFILGYFQGFLIVKTQINPFIITLALISIYHGMNMTITKNMFFRQIPTEFKAIAKYNLFGSFPLLLLIVFFVMAIFWILFNRTVLGRKMLSVGVSKRVADFAGLNAGQNIRIAHGLSGVLAALAGMLTVGKLGAAQTSIGSTWMLISFAAPILGGTLLNGGKVSIIGTFLGACLMTIITNALVLFGVNSYWFQAFTGSILLLAFAINKARVDISSRQAKETEAGGKKVEAES